MMGGSFIVKLFQSKSSVVEMNCVSKKYINQYVGNLLIFILYHCVPPSPSHTLNKLSYLLFTQKKGG